MKHALPRLVLLTLLALTPAGTQANDNFEILKNTRKLVFLGDSITYGGEYVVFFERWLTVNHSELSPWALEVIKRHPEISICDQWQFVEDNETKLYKDWWTAKNVHFKGAQADALGECLGKHVEKVMKK